MQCKQIGKNMKSNSFINEVAQNILDQKIDLRECNFIFPNRRAGFFFKKALAQLSKDGKPIFLPYVDDINHFVEGFSDMHRADEVLLLLWLLNCYNQIFPDKPQNIHQFSEFGLKLIHDFDEIDKYLVDAKKLFANIDDLGNLSVDFDFTPEQRSALEGLFHIIMPQDGTDDKNLKFHQNFVSIWNKAYDLYSLYTETLRKNNIGYEGLIFRDVCSRKSEEIATKHTYFIGFNILTASEEAVMQMFEREGFAHYYFDYNKLDRKGAKFNYSNSIRDFDFNIPSKIIEYPRMSAAEQASSLNQILKDLLKKNKNMIEENTAVVLADEGLLSNVIDAIPDEVDKFNVTMGVPLTETPISMLIQSLMQMQVTASYDHSNGKWTFYHKHVMDVLTHPYFNMIADKNKISAAIMKINKKNMIRVSESILKDINSDVFCKCDSLFSYLFSFLDLLDGCTELMESEIDSEFVNQYRNKLSLLSSYADATGIKILDSELITLMRKLSRSMKVQFKGEPLKGLQIMGLLESRLLDFDNIIFVGFNDQFIPGNSNMENSLIPYNLRIPYGLPSHEITNLIYAYNFYRSLHRCNELHIIHNVATADTSKNEPSRFQKQLKFLYNADIITESASSNIGSLGTNFAPYRIADDELEGMKDFHISPSSLKSFIKCPLKFYYEKVAGIREPDEVNEVMKDNNVGSLLHYVLEKYYTTAQKNIEYLINEAFVNVLYRSYSGKGYDVIVFGSVKKMAENVINYDKKRKPFSNVIAELKYEAMIDDIKISGVIDRIDDDDEFTRVIDYKTSVPSSLNGRVLTYNFDDMFDGNKINTINEEVMQVLTYCYCLSKSEKFKNRKLKPLLYNTYLIAKGDQKDCIDGPTVINCYDDVKNDFETRLENKIKDLKDALTDNSKFFVRATKEEHCTYCSFRNLCMTNADIRKR